jgi:hypothetical protein
LKLNKLFYIIMAIVFAASLVPALTSLSDTAFAQISPLPTNTFTPQPTSVPPTPTGTTNTPPPPTNTPSPPTNTPPPPTNTPPPPSNTPAPLPPPPVLGSLSTSLQEGVAQVNAAIDFTIVFTIEDVIDLDLVATWTWGDGNTSTCPPNSDACTIDLVAGSANQLMSSPTFAIGEVKGRHAYNEPGVYAVQLMLADKFGQFDTATFEFVVVYDPSDGFVTGGGWINSLAGAYKPDPYLAGKASFGFVSKYKKGAIRPVGNAEFRFQVADLNFHSDTLQWLVVNQNGSNAQFKGEGTINGAVAPSWENYKFMIWATDGDPDTFRIKIWYLDGDTVTVVYDNEIGQAIDRGNIVVHQTKGGS